jgi:hypothetical protein
MRVVEEDVGSQEHVPWRSGSMRRVHMVRSEVRTLQYNMLRTSSSVSLRQMLYSTSAHKSQLTPTRSSPSYGTATLV